MNGTGPTYTEAELHAGLAASADEEDFDLLLTGMADRAMTQGRSLARRRRATTVGASLAVLGLAASAAFSLRPGHEDDQPAVPPPAGITTVGATALTAYDATCFDGPVAQPSLTTYVWDPVTKQYAKTTAGPTITLSPDGRLALLQTGITTDGVTSYAVASWPDVVAGRVPAGAYRQVPAQVSLKWTTDSTGLIDEAAGRNASDPSDASIDFYNPTNLGKTARPLPAAVVDMITTRHAGGPWHVIDISGTVVDFTVTVVSKDYKQLRVITSGGQTIRNLKLPSVPSRLVQNSPRLAFSPDGRYLALWNGSGSAVYDLATASSRMVFHVERSGSADGGKPDPQNFELTGWTAHDQLFGVVRWSTSGSQQRDVHQEIRLLTPYGEEVDSVEVSVPGDTKRVCSLFTMTIGPAEDFPTATKV
ncbi:hypothetical protein [Catenulispora subtropica]|uniref:WD40 repeat domain-containing protein n=1 Tax=Catenulispora subtropica TaxID=450798 RepID=A0ABN2R0H0_9ACTN